MKEYNISIEKIKYISFTIKLRKWKIILSLETKYGLSIICDYQFKDKRFL
jgi:hypothetical protein